MNILPFYPLQVPRAVLNFLIQLADARIVLLLHFSHLFLNRLHHELLLLVVACTGAFVIVA